MAARHLAAVLLLVGLAHLGAAEPQFRTHNDRFTVAEFPSREAWQRHAAHLRERILASAGLLPMPARAPLNAQVAGERAHPDYSVFTVAFESLPGFLVTGNLYRPSGSGPFPAIVSPHGHWAYGRLENSALASVPGRAINLARQGFVVFTYDMIGYNDSRQLPHDFGGKREALWGLSVAGLQLWNAIRSVDFLESLPYVDRARLGATGASGGGTQTFLLAAVDERIAAAAPVNMISLHMQGGCICENPPGLRLDTNNVELAAAMAPRPLLMVSATGDWTKETLEVEYPAMRRLYALAGAEDRVEAVRFDAPHNYHRESREAVYAWMARWLKGAPAAARVEERAFRPENVADLLVFHGRPLPASAVSRQQLVDGWIAAARLQIRDGDPDVLRASLLQALALERPAPAPASRRPTKEVVFAGHDPALHEALRRAGFTVRQVATPAFDAQAAAAVEHFDTYNRTEASAHVAAIVAALRERPQPLLVAAGDAGPAAVLALAAAPVRAAVIDVDRFDPTDDQAFVDRLYIPGIRRAGDLPTAVAMASGAVLLHNAGGRLAIEGARVESRQLASREIVALLRSSSFVSRAAARPASESSAAADK